MKPCLHVDEVATTVTIVVALIDMQITKGALLPHLIGDQGTTHRMQKDRAKACAVVFVPETCGRS